MGCGAYYDQCEKYQAYKEDALLAGGKGRDGEETAMKGDRKCRNCPYAVYRRWLPITSECAFGGQITNSKDELFDFKPEWCEYDISPWLRLAGRRIYAEWYNLIYKIENLVQKQKGG